MEQYAVEWTEWAVHKILFWETDNVKKGHILRMVHHAMTYGLITLTIIAHTIYPAFWLQTYVLFLCVFAWIQHILTNGCVLSKVEQKLIGDESSLIDPILELFSIEASEQSKRGILTFGSTIAVSTMTLEWIARASHKIIPFALSRSQAALSSVHIPPTFVSP